MAVGKTAVLAAIGVLMSAIATEKQELKEARAEERARQDELIAAAKEGQDLSDVEAALQEATAQVQGIIDRPAPQVEIPELAESESPAEGDGSTPAETETLPDGVVAITDGEELVGGVLPDETETPESESGLVGEATPEVENPTELGG